MKKIILIIILILAVLSIVRAGDRLDSCIASTGNPEICNTVFAEESVEDYCDSITNDYIRQSCFIVRERFPLNIPTITLKPGWNLFSPTVEPTDTHRRIELDQGWNLFGYSNDELFNWSLALIDNGILPLKRVDDAADAGWIQSTIYYFDEEDQYYKLVPGDDDYLRTDVGYWIYAFQNGLTLMLPDSGSSLPTKYNWSNSIVGNGTENKTLEEAGQAGWLQETIYNYDDGAYEFVPGDDEYIYSWKGYWLYANEDLTLIIQ
jgi:hypothetical protein